MSQQNVSDLVATDVKHPCLWIDQIGAGLSLACAMHCLATPLLVAVLPLFGLSFVADEITEVVLLIFAATLAVSSLCWGFRLHKSGRVFLLLGAAAMAIAAGKLFAEDRLEIILVVAGAVILAAGHVLNRHLCRTCLDCTHPEH